MSNERRQAIASPGQTHCVSSGASSAPRRSYAPRMPTQGPLAAPRRRCQLRSRTLRALGAENLSRLSSSTERLLTAPLVALFGSRPRPGGINSAIETSYRSFLNSSTLRPASRTMPPSVKALTGFARGMVRIRRPSDMTMCLPWRTTSKPARSRARTARLWLTPGMRGKPRRRLRSRGPGRPRAVPRRRPGTRGWRP